MPFSRRQLLTALGLALPAVTVLAAEAEAASATGKKHHTKHPTHVTHVAHKSHGKPTTHATPTRG